MIANIVMVGMDQWEKFTLPAIQSFQRHEPQANIVVVDHGKRPYPGLDGVEIVRLEKPVCYAKALNIGISRKKADWYFITNNDVVCNGKFLPEALDESVIYADKVYRHNGEAWFDNCFVLVSNKVWWEVGGFDEAFLMAAFEDADFSFRAQELGYRVAERKMPFTHYEGSTRTKMSGYSEIRNENFLYLTTKHPERRIHDFIQ